MYAPGVVAFQPLIQAVGRDAEAAGDFGHRVTTLGYLFGRFNLELFRETRLAHDTFLSGLV
ncbi:hypothetical protein VI06_21320 [Aquitalea magnusonii]|nr:hypothetical protein VI06_21320 [Aquitalea magnusonii]